MQVLCREDELKSNCCLRKTSDRIKLLTEYGKFDLEWFSRVLWSDESIFQLHADLQRGVFEDLVRNTIVEVVSWCGEHFQLADTIAERLASHN